MKKVIVRFGHNDKLSQKYLRSAFTQLMRYYNILWKDHPPTSFDQCIIWADKHITTNTLTTKEIVWDSENIQYFDIPHEWDHAVRAILHNCRIIRSTIKKKEDDSNLHRQI